MLVLTRNRGQTVRVGEMNIKIVSVHGDRVRLGFEGPRDVQVVRPDARLKSKKGRGDEKPT